MTGTETARPRQLNLAQTFNQLVHWAYEHAAKKKKTSGFLIGLSGTDSLLAFLVCAKAYERLGAPERVLGLHFGPAADAVAGASAARRWVTEQNPAYAKQWFANNRRSDTQWFNGVMDWLREQAPGARVELDSTIDHTDDYMRWAALYKKAAGAEPASPGACAIAPAQSYWLIGTRNRTEDALGTYSNISAGVSLQPLVHLWKSEVLELCEYLGVPEIALEKSREADCGCGRFDLAASNIEEVDMALMAEKGELSRAYLERSMPGGLLKDVEKFVKDQTRIGSFKRDIPYAPPPLVF